MKTWRFLTPPKKFQNSTKAKSIPVKLNIWGVSSVARNHETCYSWCNICLAKQFVRYFAERGNCIFFHEIEMVLAETRSMCPLKFGPGAFDILHLGKLILRAFWIAIGFCCLFFFMHLYDWFVHTVPRKSMWIPRSSKLNPILNMSYEIQFGCK